MKPTCPKCGSELASEAAACLKCLADSLTGAGQAAPATNTVPQASFLAGATFSTETARRFAFELARPAARAILARKKADAEVIADAILLPLRTLAREDLLRQERPTVAQHVLVFENVALPAGDPTSPRPDALPLPPGAPDYAVPTTELAELEERLRTHREMPREVRERHHQHLVDLRRGAEEACAYLAGGGDEVERALIATRLLDVQVSPDATECKLGYTMTSTVGVRWQQGGALDVQLSVTNPRQLEVAKWILLRENTGRIVATEANQATTMTGAFWRYAAPEPAAEAVQRLLHQFFGRPANEPLTDFTLYTTQGCFVATAAFGTPFAQEIDVLRAYRDETLRPHPVGRLLVRAYECCSPPVARLIGGSALLRAGTRAALRPVVERLARQRH